MAAATLLGAGSSYIQHAETWRHNYEAGLKAPDGWLSVVGLFWLHPGENTFGSDAKSDVVLPAGTPPHAGKLLLQGGKVTLLPENRELRPDTSGQPGVVRFGDVSVTVIERGGRTGIRIRDLNAKTRREYTGSHWYPIDQKWRVQAAWRAYPEPKKIAITNILGMTDQEPSPGYAEFTIDGKRLRLEPVTEDGLLFFMFKDSTNGAVTYGAGRFLYAAQPREGRVVLDFNEAKNPPCAFTAYATCPLPPRQNRLPVAVAAGEKKYGAH